jgi:hypothetical protein
MPSTSQESEGLSSLRVQERTASDLPDKVSRDSRKMRHHSAHAPVEQAVRILAVTRGKCEPVSAWRVVDWHMDVDGSVRESRDLIRRLMEPMARRKAASNQYEHIL